MGIQPPPKKEGAGKNRLTRMLWIFVDNPSRSGHPTIGQVLDAAKALIESKPDLRNERIDPELNLIHIETLFRPKPLTLKRRKR
jgi:hypothetical protein